MSITVKKLFMATMLLSFVMAASAHANSLWNNNTVSAFASQRPYRTGDVIMVLVIENTSALQKVGTDTQNQDNISGNINHTIERLNGLIGPSNSVQAAKGSSFKGSGSTARSSSILATIAATVTSVLPNGNLVISGKHKISVNDEAQELTITGTVRPNDVTSWNTIYSYQVADSAVSVKGSGVVGDVQSPGMVARFLNWIF